MGRLTISGFQTPGFIKDIGEYVSVPEAFNDVRNIRFNPRGAVTVAGHAVVMSPAPYSPIWLKMFPPLENPNWVYADAHRVGMFRDGHYDITRLSGQYETPPSERWAGAVFNGIGIFNNTFDIPQQWLEFNSDTPLENLSNWPSTLRCKFIKPFKQLLIAGNLTDSTTRQPSRIRWSHPADPGTVPISWELGNPAIDAGEFDIAESADALIDGETLGDQFIVYKQKSVHSMQLGGPDIFTRRELFATRGVLTRDCIQSLSIGHFVVGVDDIYVHAGQRGTDQSIVDNRLRDWIFNQISKDNYFYCYTVAWRRLNEIWFCFPEAGETYPTLALIYNTVTHGLGVKDIPRVPFMYPGPVIRATNSPTWGDGESTPDVDPDPIEYDFTITPGVSLDEVGYDWSVFETEPTFGILDPTDTIGEDGFDPVPNDVLSPGLRMAKIFETDGEFAVWLSGPNASAIPEFTVVVDGTTYISTEANTIGFHPGGGSLVYKWIWTQVGEVFFDGVPVGMNFTLN